MKKKQIGAICIVSVMSILLTGCCLFHDWQDATCTTPKTCAKCGETEGEALGHDWQDATCTEAKTCSVCGETKGEALGHDWQEATCIEPKTCAVCGVTEGAALGHKWQKATCTEPKICSVCGETEGEALGHDWQEANCLNPKTCRICWTTEGNIGDHTWVDATCLAPKTCAVCREMIGEKASHNFNENGICTMCGTSREIQLTKDNVGDFLTVTFEETVEDKGMFKYQKYIITVAPISQDYIFQDVQVCFGRKFYSPSNNKNYDEPLHFHLSGTLDYHDIDSEGNLVHIFRGGSVRDPIRVTSMYIYDVRGTCIRK